MIQTSRGSQDQILQHMSVHGKLPKKKTDYKKNNISPFFSSGSYLSPKGKIKIGIISNISGK